MTSDRTREAAQAESMVLRGGLYGVHGAAALLGLETSDIERATRRGDLVPITNVLGRNVYSRDRLTAWRDSR